MPDLQLAAMRILVVEDTTAQAQQRALERASEETFDVALLDVPAPDAHALECVRNLRAALAQLPVVVLSGVEDEELAGRVLQAGAQDFLIKDRVDETALRRALRNAIERQKLVDRVANSQARLQEENALLRGLTDAAQRIFATLDARAIVDVLAAEARRLVGGSAALYGKGPKPDEFLSEAFAARKPTLSADGMRVAMPIPGTSGRNEWILDIRASGNVFGENDVFALDLLRQYSAIAIQNVALFAELQSQRSSVIRANALKDDLIALLAHDFKGPLTTVIGFTELLEQHAVEGEEADAACRTILQSAARLTKLADDTLGLSRVEQGDLNLDADPINLAALVADAAEPFLSEREIRVRIEAQEPVVRGDSARLRQVLENIIGNAVKYSPDGQPVDIAVKENERSVRVSVSDSGIGIPANEMKLMFERFRRGSNAKRSNIKGTGLGLYLAKTLVERHGGTIQVRSIIDRGSEFTIVLPRMRDGVGGILRVAVLTSDANLAPYVLHELRSHAQTARHDKTLTALLARIDVEQPDVVIVDRDTIGTDLQSLFARAAQAKPPIGLVAVGAGMKDAAADLPWHAVLPNPFLGSDLREAIALADRGRMRKSKWKPASS